MKRMIVFKTNSFPNISETFIVSNIKETIDADFKVNIIVDSINSIENTSQPDLLVQYSLLDLVSKLEQPQGKVNRYIKALKLLLNPVLFYYFIKYSIHKGKKTLDYIFILQFYNQYRAAAAFHVHFATAINPLFELKEIGFLKSKIVITFHGYDEHYLPKDELLKNVINNFNKHVDSITVNTLYLKNKLVSRGFDSTNIKIIPIGIDTFFFHNNKVQIINKEPFKLISVGRLVEIKGHFLGISAIKILKDRGYKIVYTLIGYGNEFKNLQQLVKDLNLENMVLFKGARNQNEIKKMLGEQDLFLMTSTSDKHNRCEAFGLVSLEAQAMGLPVIGFKSGGFPETLVEGKTGITVEDKNIVAMANCIEKFIKNPELLSEMSTNAVSHVNSKFDLKITNQQYIDLYDALKT